jgi:polyisoprenoid-binding protein YceI
MRPMRPRSPSSVSLSASLHCSCPLVVAALLSLTSCSAATAPAARAAQRQPHDRASSAETANQPVSGRRYVVVAAACTLRIVAFSLAGAHPVDVARFSGHADVVEHDLSRSRVYFEIDMTSISARSASLTRLIRSARLLDVTRFPRARFVSTKIRPSPSLEHDYMLSGKLTLHGVTRALEVVARVRRAARRFVVSTRFSIRRQDFGVTPGGLVGLLVHDDVEVQLQVVAEPADSP